MARMAMAWIAAAALISGCTSSDESPLPSVVTDASGSGAASVDPSLPSEPAPSGEATASGEAISAFDLEVGDCFTAPDADTVSDVALIDCAEPHEYETYHIENHPAGRGEDFIGDEAMTAFADDVCLGAFEAFVGISWEDSTLSYFYLQPTAETWEEVGDREVLCAVYSDKGDLTGSVEGSER